MTKIVNIDNFILNKKFNSEVLPFFKKLNPSFDYFIDEKEAAFVLNTGINIIVFLNYIPRSIFTDLPTVDQSFNDIKSNPRNSEGEWVVSSIYEIPVDKLFDILNELKKEKEKVNFLKQKIIK